MIIIRLVGGLGNQLFQYAFGRRLAMKNNQKLKLDIGGYASNIGDPKIGIREYGLKHFNIGGEIATEEDLRIFGNFFRKDFIGKIYRKTHRHIPGNYYKKKYIVEPAANYFKFDEKIVKYNITRNVYVEGYWQSERYFSEIENVIRKEFSFNEGPDELNKKMIMEMSDTESVSIHIRHGDNVTGAAKNHGVLSMDYYQKAISKLSQKIKEPNFYVFSDDPEWAKENLIIKHDVNFVSHNGDEKNYEDLRLMSECKHHIIGNSTFSWWGAWLGKNEKQIVYAPKYYHVNVDLTDTDFFCKNWNII